MATAAVATRRKAGTVLGPNGKPYETTPDLTEKGFSGTLVTDGLFDDEYLSEIEDRSERLDQYKRMWRGDPQIAAIRTVVTLPLQAAEWTIDVGDGKGVPGDAKEVLESNLFGDDDVTGMTVSFREFLAQSIRAVFWGVEVFEKCFLEMEGQVRWKKFAQRRPDSIEKWLFDNEGGVAGVHQKGWKTSQDGTAEEVEADIPIEKLLCFQHQREDGNWEGMGVLRTAYPHWRAKKRLFMYALIAAERGAVGTPIGFYGEGYDSPDTLQTFLENLRSHETSAGVFKRGQVEFEKLDLSNPGTLRMVLELIRAIDADIARILLCDFLMLGTGGDTGTYALSKDRSSLFMHVEEGISRWWSDTFNRYALPQLCRFNWGILEKYPKIRCARIGKVDAAGLADILQKITVGEVWLTPTPDMQRHIADELGLPMSDDDMKALRDEYDQKKSAAAEMQQLGVQGAQAALEQPAGVPGAPGSKALGPGQQAPPTVGGKKPAGKLIPFGRSSKSSLEIPGRQRRRFEDGEFEAAEGDYPDDEEMEGEGRHGEILAAATGFEEAALEGLQTMYDGLDATLQEAIRGEDVGSLAALKVKGIQKFEDAVRLQIVRIYEAGRASLAEEEGVEDLGPPSKAFLAWAKVKANVIADSFGSRMRTQAVGAALDAMAGGLTAGETLTNARAQMRVAMQDALDEIGVGIGESVVGKLNAMLEEE